jgi:hypothetical protein
MKKLSAILLLTLWSQAVLSGEYRSSFGYSFQLSKDWLVLTPKEVSKQYESETIKALNLEFADRNNAQSILERVKTGKVEFYFDRKYSTKDFKNNISVQIMPGSHTPTAQEVKEQCSAMPNELRSLYGSGVKVGNCGLATSHGVAYVTYEYFVSQQGVTIVQQEIPYVSNSTAIVAGGSNAAGLANLKSAQLSVVESITKFVSASLTPRSTGRGTSPNKVDTSPGPTHQK